MNRRASIVLVCLLVVGVFPCAGAKQSLSVNEAKRAVGEVAAQQQFPEDYKLLKMGSLKAEGIYFHIFTTYLKERQRWRTLVFANSGNYLGYYETNDEPDELDAGGIIYPGSSSTEEFSEEGEDGEVEFFEIEFSDAHLIEFTEDGPPDFVDVDAGSYTFVSSPKRVWPADPAYRFLLVAERLVDTMNRRRYRYIREDFSTAAREKLSEEQGKAVFTSLRQKFGDVKHLDTPWLQPPDTAVFPATFKEGIFGLKVTLDDHDEIIGLWFLPYSIAFPEIGIHPSALTLPFDGRWRVLWGGDTKDANRHYGNRSQQYALEFVIADRYGRTYEEEGKKNEDYFAFGRPVLAPAAGRVIGVVQGVKDNKPGSPNPYSALGNAVIIQHSTNEVSVLSHLKHESIVVKVGDNVDVRQPVGLCGNSGDTEEPRIHFHLQDSPVIQTGSGYRLVFDRVLVWNRSQALALAKHTPIQGSYVEQQLLRPKEPAPARDGVEVEQASK